MQRADTVVLTYACDRPETLENLSIFWLPHLRKLEVLLFFIFASPMAICSVEAPFLFFRIEEGKKDTKNKYSYFIMNGRGKTQINYCKLLKPVMLF